MRNREEVIKEKEYIEKEISRINDLFTKGLMSFSLYKLEVLQKQTALDVLEFVLDEENIHV